VALVVVLDPGHPSTDGDTGCTAPGFTEVDYVLEIAYLFHDHLKESDFDVSAALTRWTNDTHTFGTRRHVVRVYKPDLIISLHVDSNTDDRVWGIQGYRLLGDPLAHGVAAAICRVHPRKGEYVRSGLVRPRRSSVVVARKDHWSERAHYVLSQYPDYTRCLIELGFASNPEEREWLLSEEGKATIVNSLTAGVDYLVREKKDV
jgi:N-acetylmuramoyl-L-alanine amidase